MENEYDIINNKISNETFERLDQQLKILLIRKSKKEEGEEEKV